MKEPRIVEKENDEDEFPGYPAYPENEDIFNTQTREESINPDTISERTLPNLSNELDVKPLDEYDFVGSELDIPGTELDDDQEFVGTEDEENNYYSLGGDNHESLEEDNEGF